MSLAKKVKIVEVSPRDGLQNEVFILPTALKIELINRLAETGLSVIEATSFVSPKWIPQLADAEIVLGNLIAKPAIQYPVLVPNVQGLKRAIRVGAKSIAVFTTPSESFSQRNVHCSVKESLKKIAEVIQLAKTYSLSIRGYLSCVVGCPYEGEISPKQVMTLAAELMAMGCEEISLGDTLGVGTPFKVQHLIEEIATRVPISQLAVHFHDTYGQALANIYAALSLGVAIIDSSVSGLGGCPYAKGASGNVATEEVVYMLQGMGIETGIDLQKLIEVGQFISQSLGRSSRSKVNQAMRRNKYGI